MHRLHKNRFFIHFYLDIKDFSFTRGFHCLFPQRHLKKIQGIPTGQLVHFCFISRLWNRSSSRIQLILCICPYLSRQFPQPGKIECSRRPLDLRYGASVRASNRDILIISSHVLINGKRNLHFIGLDFILWLVMTVISSSPRRSTTSIRSWTESLSHKSSPRSWTRTEADISSPP